MTIPELVEWPDHDPNYQDSGEGGLFAYLVIEHDPAMDICHVDVTASLTSPDVLVHPHSAHDLWQDYDWKHTHAGTGALLAADVPNPYGWDHPGHHSTGLAAAVYLGSTPYSLWSGTGGHYFFAGYEALTVHGRAVYDALEAAYGVKPQILTFLDT